MKKTLAYIPSLVFLAGTAQASFLPPGGTTGSVQYRTSATQFGGEAAFTYDATNNRLALSSATTATDNATQMFSVTGTMPAVPSTAVVGVNIGITSAGSAAQEFFGFNASMTAGYTGASTNVAATFTNNVAGTGNNLQLSSVTAPTFNGAVRAQGIGSVTGLNIGTYSNAQGSSATNVASYSRAISAVAGNNIGVLGNAANSSEATDLKNVGVYGTLNSSLLTGTNGNYAGLFDGGTLTSANDNSVRSFVTAPNTSGQWIGAYNWLVTTAGTNPTELMGGRSDILAGYTGNKFTTAFFANNGVAGTGTDLALTNGVSTDIEANYGIAAAASATTTGVNSGVYGYGWGSTTTNFGVHGAAHSAIAGNNIGVIGSAANSTEATDLKNVAVYGTLNSSLITGLNGSYAGLFDGGTLPDSNSAALSVRATLPSSPASTTGGAFYNITSAGSASQTQLGMQVGLLAGYTGSSDTRVMNVVGRAKGTGATLHPANGTAQAFNAGLYVDQDYGSSGAGIQIGSFAGAANSTGYNIAHYGKAVSATAGTNIGVLAGAGDSTEATDFKNVAGYFTLNDTLVTASNISVALVAQSSGSEPLMRAYDGTTLAFEVADAGSFRQELVAGQTIAAGGTVAADSCGGFKRITSAGDVTTDTTNTFSAPAASNGGCIMHVCNLGSFNITLDSNANFRPEGGTDKVLGSDDCIIVASGGNAGSWFQMAPMSVN